MIVNIIKRIPMILLVDFANDYVFARIIMKKEKDLINNGRNVKRNEAIK